MRNFRQLISIVVILSLITISTALNSEAQKKPLCQVSNCLECSPNDEFTCVKCDELYSFSNEEDEERTVCSKDSISENKGQCHYSCLSCSESGSSHHCLTCPESRKLKTQAGLNRGRCVCSDSKSTDIGQPICEVGGYSADQLNAVSYTIQGLVTPIVVGGACLSGDPTFAFLLIEMTQRFNALSYINNDHTVNLSEFLQSFKFMNFDRLFPPIASNIYHHYHKQECEGNPKIEQDSYASDNALINTVYFLFACLMLCVISITFNSINADASSNPENFLFWRRVFSFSAILIYLLLSFQSVTQQLIYSIDCSSSPTGIIILFSVLIIPAILFIYYFNQKQSEKYQILLLILDNSTFMKRLYLLTWILKRLFISFIIVKFSSNPHLQTILVTSLQLISSYHFIKYAPLKVQDDKTNKFAIYSEFGSSALSLIFTMKVLLFSTSESRMLDSLISIGIVLFLSLISLKGLFLTYFSMKAALNAETVEQEFTKKINASQIIQASFNENDGVGVKVIQNNVHSTQGLKFELDSEIMIPEVETSDQ